MSVVFKPGSAYGPSVTARYFGAGDGSRTVFNLAGLDSDRAYLMPLIYLDQTLQTVTTHYTVDAAGKVTFVTAPAAGKVVNYKDPWSPSGNIYRAFGMGDGVSTDFSLPFVPKVPVLYRTDWQGKQQLYPTARTNVALQSQTLASATWNKANCTVTADTVVAPDGTTTADTIVATANGVVDVYQTGLIATDTALTYSIFTKAGTRLTSDFLVRNDTAATNYDIAEFTYATGAITGAGWSVVTLTGGWFRLVYTKSTGITVGDSLRVYAGATSASPVWVAGETAITWGSDMKFGPFSAYIPTVASPVTVTDYSYTPAGDVTLAVAPVTGALLTGDFNMGPMP